MLGRLCSMRIRGLCYRWWMFGILECSMILLRLILLRTRVFFVLSNLIITIFSFGSIRKISNNRRRNSISNLPGQQRRRRRRSLNNPLKKKEQIIKPTGSNKIINKMTNPICKYLLVIKSIKSIISISYIK